MGVLPHSLHHGGQIRFDLASGSGNAQRGHHIEKPLRLSGDHGDPVFRCRRDEGDQLHPILPANRQEFLLLLKGQIGEDQSVDPRLPAGGEESLRSIGEHHIGVGHKNQRYRYIPAQVPHQSEDPVRGDPALQGPEVSPLDHRTLGDGVGEGNAQLDEVRAVFHSSPDGGGGGLQIRVAAGDKRDKCLSAGKCLCDLTHGDPPLCIGRWRHSPCRLGPRW